MDALTLLIVMPLSVASAFGLQIWSMTRIPKPSPASPPVSTSYAQLVLEQAQKLGAYEQARKQYEARFMPEPKQSDIVSAQAFQIMLEQEAQRSATLAPNWREAWKKRVGLDHEPWR